MNPKSGKTDNLVVLRLLFGNTRKSSILMYPLQGVAKYIKGTKIVNPHCESKIVNPNCYTCSIIYLKLYVFYLV